MKIVLVFEVKCETTICKKIIGMIPGSEKSDILIMSIGKHIEKMCKDINTEGGKNDQSHC